MCALMNDIEFLTEAVTRDLVEYLVRNEVMKRLGASPLGE